MGMGVLYSLGFATGKVPRSNVRGITRGWSTKNATHNLEIVFKIKLLSHWLDIREIFNADARFCVDKSGFGGNAASDAVMLFAVTAFVEHTLNRWT